jgi:hypothetical protein
MGTINQPTPSNPGSPPPDQQPLQPGGPQVSGTNTNDVYRSNPQSPDDHDSNNRDSGPEHKK